MKKAILLAAALVAGFFAHDAAAQESTIIYRAEPSSLVTINVDNRLDFIGTTNGTMTATVFAMTGTVTDGNFTPDAEGITGTLMVTLEILDRCGIIAGCSGAFGLTAADYTTRLTQLLSMDFRTASMFIASGADINEQVGFRTPPIIGSIEERYLVEHILKAKNNAVLSAFVLAGANLQIVNVYGWTPMHRAVANADPIAVSLLISANAEVDRADHGPGGGDTPLSEAALSRNPLATSVITMLLSAGANVNHASGFGTTPLHNAIIAGDSAIATSIISILLSAGASVNATDTGNRTPLDSALNRGYNNIVALLIAAGGICRSQTSNPQCPSAGQGLRVSFQGTPNVIFIPRTGRLANSPGLIGILTILDDDG